MLATIWASFCKVLLGKEHIIINCVIYFTSSEMLRDISEPLKYRREVLSRITQKGITTLSFDKGQTLGERSVAFFFSLRRMMSKWKDTWWDNGSILILWASDIKDIEGKFGSGVGTYFRFQRVLITLNMNLSINRIIYMVNYEINCIHFKCTRPIICFCHVMLTRGLTRPYSSFTL